MVGNSATGPAVAGRPVAVRRGAPSFWRASRVRDWAHFLLLPLAGYQSGVELGANALALGRGVIIAFCVLAFGYLLNGIADRGMDDARKNPLVDSGPDRRYLLTLVALVAIALSASLLGPWVATAGTLLVLLSGVVYSVGPRLKRYPFLGTLTNATNFTPLLWVGLPAGATAAGSGMGLITGAFVLLLLQNQLIHEAADRGEDRRGGIRTTFLILGTLGSTAVVAGLGLGLAALCLTAGLLGPGIAAGAVFGLAAPAVTALRGDQPHIMATARWSHRVASLALGGWLFIALRVI